MAPISLIPRQAPEKHRLPVGALMLYHALSPDTQGSIAGVGSGTPLAQRGRRLGRGCQSQQVSLVPTVPEGLGQKHKSSPQVCMLPSAGQRLEHTCAFSQLAYTSHTHWRGLGTLLTLPAWCGGVARELSSTQRDPSPHSRGRQLLARGAKAPT